MPFFSEICLSGQRCAFTKQLLQSKKVQACHRRLACLASTSLGKRSHGGHSPVLDPVPNVSWKGEHHRLNSVRQSWALQLEAQGCCSLPASWPANTLLSPQGKQIILRDHTGCCYKQGPQSPFREEGADGPMYPQTEPSSPFRGTLGVSHADPRPDTLKTASE